MKINVLTRAQLNREIVRLRGWTREDGVWKQGKTDFYDWCHLSSMPNYLKSANLLRDLVAVLSKKGRFSLHWEPKSKQWNFAFDTDGQHFERIGKTANEVIASVFYIWQTNDHFELKGHKSGTRLGEKNEKT